MNGVINKFETTVLYSHYNFERLISVFMEIITVCYLDLQNSVIISPRLHSLGVLMTAVGSYKQNILTELSQQIASF